MRADVNGWALPNSPFLMSLPMTMSTKDNDSSCVEEISWLIILATNIFSFPLKRTKVRVVWSLISLWKPRRHDMVMISWLKGARRKSEFFVWWIFWNDDDNDDDDNGDDNDDDEMMMMTITTVMMMIRDTFIWIPLSITRGPVTLAVALLCQETPRHLEQSSSTTTNKEQRPRTSSSFCQMASACAWKCLRQVSFREIKFCFMEFFYNLLQTPGPGTFSNSVHGTLPPPSNF